MRGERGKETDRRSSALTLGSIDVKNAAAELCDSDVEELLYFAAVCHCMSSFNCRQRSRTIMRQLRGRRRFRLTCSTRCFCSHALTASRDTTDAPGTTSFENKG